MNKFLDLTYYKNRDFTFPNYLKTSVGNEFIGIQTHYIDLSNSNYGDEVFKKFNKESDLELINNLIDKHGIFFEKFLAKNFRHRLNNYFKDEEDLNYLIESCRKYYDKNEKRNRLVDKVKQDFLKVSLIRLKNDEFHKKLEVSVYEKSKNKTCAICNNSYKPIKLPDWVHYGANGNDNICFECPTAKYQNKRELKVLIRKLIEILNFIPNADFNPINHNFSSRVDKNNWIDVCRIIFQIGIKGNDALTSDSIFKKKFGSWFKALVDSKVLPDGLLETGRGIRCIAKSGNECNSLDEMFIDNWLFEKNIISIKEPFYPKHKLYNKSGRRRADWKVGDYFIEYFGLKGEENYDKKTKEKLLLANNLNLKLISIFPSDLNNISDKLNILNK